MAAVLHNHINFQGRLDFVQSLLQEQYSLEEKAQISPIHYDPESLFKYNNFVYRISFPAPLTTRQVTKNRVEQAGCVPTPVGTKELIIRLTNSDAGEMYKTNRVENEVAMITLASAALVEFVPHLVPSVYGWGSAAVESSQGWIIQELMPGTPVGEAFRDMDLEQKRPILSQMARMLKSLQKYKLPESITGFGGLKFDHNGRMINAAMPTVGAGPWTSYEAFFRGSLEVALQNADTSPWIKGWHARGVRERLDAFVKHGIAAHFESLGSKEDRVIIHADFNPSNLLFETESGRITGLIDYDFSCISHPSYEFLRSFNSAGGKFPGWNGDEASDDMEVSKAKLYGFPSPLPPSTKKGVQWDVMKAWEDELERLDVKRPSNIRGIDKVADVETVLDAILPWRLHNEDALKLQREEAILKCREEKEKHLVGLLDHFGF